MSASYPPLASSVIETIGNTPLVELTGIVRSLNLEGRLLAKCEYFNPGFSKKDRIALEMVRVALEQGELKPGQPVVELTSGNTGTGLAIACKALGHPFIAVMSRGNTVERARMMQALGAKVVLVDQAPGSPDNQVSGEDLALVEQETRRQVEQHRAFRANQFKLKSSIYAHERHTGPEIWEQSGGTVDVFVDFSGTGGSFTGVMSCLKKKNPEICGYVVEPASAPALAGGTITCQSHKIQGGGYSMPELDLLDRSLVTGFLSVSDEEAIRCARLLASEAGLFGGFSSGANLAGALQLLRRNHAGQTIAFLLSDSGLKYLSTDLYPWREEESSAESPSVTQE